MGQGSREGREGGAKMEDGGWHASAMSAVSAVSAMSAMSARGEGWRIEDGMPVP